MSLFELRAALRARLAVAGACLSLLAWTAGCSPTKPGLPTARLEGQVTIGDKPVASGSLQFMPQGPGKPAAAPITDGHYVAAAVPLGKVTVLVTAIAETGRTIQEGGHEFPERIDLVPESARQGIPLEVTGDNSQQHFALGTR